MSPDQEKQWQNLQTRQAMLANRLQQIADSMGSRAIRRELGVKRTDDRQLDANDTQLWEATFARIEEITSEQERLLEDAGILPGRSEENE